MRRTGLSTSAALRYREWSENPSSMVEKSSCHLLPCTHRLILIHLLEQPCATGSEARIRPPWWRRVAATCFPVSCRLTFTHLLAGTASGSIQKGKRIRDPPHKDRWGIWPNLTLPYVLSSKRTAEQNSVLELYIPLPLWPLYGTHHIGCTVIFVLTSEETFIMFDSTSKLCKGGWSANEFHKS